jgi:hypothetical protein
MPQLAFRRSHRRGRLSGKPATHSDCQEHAQRGERRSDQQIKHPHSPIKPRKPAETGLRSVKVSHERSRCANGTLLRVHVGAQVPSDIQVAVYELRRPRPHARLATTAQAHRMGVDRRGNSRPRQCDPAQLAVPFVLSVPLWCQDDKRHQLGLRLRRSARLSSLLSAPSSLSHVQVSDRESPVN